MEHIVKSFDEELTRLRDTLARMGSLSASQFENALEALTERDEALARKVGGGDQEVDQMEQAINELVVRVLALRAPMADDLRMVVTALKVASDLERVADYAANIARRTLNLGEGPALPSVRTVGRIGTLVKRQLRDVLDAYVQRDADKALAVWNSDQEVDEMYSGLFRELLTYMMEDPKNIGAASHLLFIAKNIERIGDHATNIGEMVYFIITGRRIEGERPKNDSSSSVVA
ncbi:phosphate signaling complex protein PhoU [Telmatospirillum siberiense]|uniref:Phosphate-specific transport system accessory protein PhoU n=1 Tax=Telmatospirillum siberiense TaxID=382514 RepID=A0A2N3PSC3_9PROT|nr:phosphate signaling complex protein PhoU [Telmatospirillum siberiense]PKU23300.1 phosphate transport system regulatory protein PhoU [Telmatospirillum siberiense]